MHADLKTALNTQANHELFAAHSYDALSRWCSDLEFDGFAGFFTKQAVEEREHAGRFLDYLQDRGEQVTLSAIDAPVGTFPTLKDVALHALELEQTNTAKIHACYRAAVATDEIAALPFLLQFIEEQVEEEAWADKMVTMVARCECPGAQLSLDRHLEKILGA